MTTTPKPAHTPTPTETPLIYDWNVTTIKNKPDGQAVALRIVDGGRCRIADIHLGNTETYSIAERETRRPYRPRSQQP